MKKIIIGLIIVLALGGSIFIFKDKLFKKENKVQTETKKKMIDLTGKTLEEIESFKNENKIEFEIVEEFNTAEKGQIFAQSLKVDEELKDHLKIKISISKGIDYTGLNINEMGNVPIMMYHGIVNKETTSYTGGNVDKAGYNRLASAFRRDLEFYYENNYRMIRLDDYVEGMIKTEAGKSPIILTFDDGLANNLTVTGLNEKGEIIIDPNSAVGILEEFKKKYPDFNVTATFFVNQGLFNQTEYNDKILKWLVDNGYDVGNHTMTHANLQNITTTKTASEVKGINDLLNGIIPNKYVKIIALPFGTPYNFSHPNFKEVLNQDMKAALRVGWEAEVSPFSNKFEPRYLKRIRAYDNNGKEFDIEMNFKILLDNRFISDGDEKTITVKAGNEGNIKNGKELKIITY